MVGIQIIDRDRGVVALRIGHGPLLELAVLGADHQHQAAGADQRLLLLDGDADEEIVRGHADDVGVLHQVDAVRQQIAQRRLRQRIDVLGRELAVAHRQRRSIGDDRDRARRVIFEAHLAGLLDVEIALGLAAVGPDDNVIIPRNSVKTDWEVELGVVIGSEAKYVEESKALDYVAGYCVVNDLSERTFQLEGTGQWVKGRAPIHLARSVLGSLRKMRFLIRKT